MKKDLKICVGLSGGVDSSVAALLLKEAGYDVFALFMQNWHDTTGTLHGECEWEEDLNVARMVAKKIGIPFHFVDLSDVYRQRVVDYMFSEYEKGRTPNPDVMCNSQIKFDAFLKAAQELGADMVATGHYCRKEIVRLDNGEAVPVVDGGVLEEDGGLPTANGFSGVAYRILEGVDPNKDQSYFLCQLTQYQLSKAVFPIGGMVKPEVRRIANEAQLPSAEKKDSQGICFVGKVDLPVFLQQKLKATDGNVVEIFPEFYDTLNEYYPGYGTLPSGEYQIGKSSPPSVGPLPFREPKFSDSDIPLPEAMVHIHGEPKFSDLGIPLPDSGVHIHTVQGDPNGLPTKEVTFGTEIEGEMTDERLEALARVYRYKEGDGKVIGRHFGAQFFTIGQRKGLNIGGHKESIFVISTDISTNTIYVGEGHHHPGLLRKALKINNDEVHWIREDLRMMEGESREMLVRIRYRQPLQQATLYQRKDALYIVFREHQRGISAGQFAAWYAADFEMLGSGIIC